MKLKESYHTYSLTPQSDLNRCTVSPCPDPKDLLIFKHFILKGILMNKLYILIFSFLFASYASAYFYDKGEKNITSKIEYSQSNTDPQDPEICAWPPCDVW